MKVLPHRVAGQPVQVRVLESRDDTAEVLHFAASRERLAIDTETTGLDIYHPDFRVRLVQLGDTDRAYVVPVERGFGDVAEEALRLTHQAICHNATFDVLALDRAGMADYDELVPKVVDTRITAHLLDPRAQSEGGVGHGLKPLSESYVDAEAPDTQKDLHDVFRTEGLKVDEGFARIDLDHPIYLLYAGLDVILTSRLHRVLSREMTRRGFERLCSFEHEVQRLLGRLERRGFRLDVPYAQDLVGNLAEQAAEGRRIASTYGVENIGSTRQIAAALQELGAELTERTPSGAWQVDKAVLSTLEHRDDAAGRLARGVMQAKRAEKWSTAYAQAMLDLRDSNDRVHAKLNGLQARTARMSVARPPLQQLPSGDWTIRRCVVADPGHIIVAADYSQVELRVLAALSGERNMTEAILRGDDLHDTTARLIWGEQFTKAQRKIAKAGNFLTVYGGGAATLARNAGIDPSTASTFLSDFRTAYPGVKRYARSLEINALYGEDRAVVTPTGRRLPLDGDRMYAALNYVIQSTARDLLAEALLRLEDTGLGDYLLLPVHDEVIAQAPTNQAEEVAHEIGKVMSTSLHGIPIDAEGEVYGPSWGHGYGAPL
ncbi:hypothetical protein GCM10012275_56550 [Longimycelium tulufanense]|uniref:DNA polymerase I n=1 Tax=Longimycelium tulufanense TaxID=907463 RepID=A0A8J3CHL7_9PSEU|nr:DNA polymerase [Longimycelium tulufanense]GGM78598.1 hypothetical protein GCM10012275_56550 [Longimycelium tulufanense]